MGISPRFVLCGVCRYVCDSSERSAELLKKLHQRIDEAGHMVRHATPI
jgi:hypothetical protein